MNVNEILKLIDAGFTVDEIRKMDFSGNAKIPETPAAPDPVPASDPEPESPSPDPVPALDPKPESPGPDPLDAIKQQIAGLTGVVEQMSKAIVMPTIDNVQPLGLDDIVKRFFKED